MIKIIDEGIAIDLEEILYIYPSLNHEDKSVITFKGGEEQYIPRSVADRIFLIL